MTEQTTCAASFPEENKVNTDQRGAPEGAFFDLKFIAGEDQGYEGTETGRLLPDRWPDLSFEISEQPVFGRPTLPTNQDARVRSVFSSLSRAVSTECPDRASDLDFARPASKKEAKELEVTSVRETAMERLARIHHFLHGRFDLGRDKVRRKSVIDLDRLGEQLMADSRQLNEPVSQIYDRVVADNQKRLNRQKVVGNQDPVLSERDLINLRTDLAIIFDPVTFLIETKKGIKQAQQVHAVVEFLSRALSTIY